MKIRTQCFKSASEKIITHTSKQAEKAFFTSCPISYRIIKSKELICFKLKPNWSSFSLVKRQNVCEKLAADVLAWSIKCGNNTANTEMRHGEKLMKTKLVSKPGVLKLFAE